MSSSPSPHVVVVVVVVVVVAVASRRVVVVVVVVLRRRRWRHVWDAGSLSRLSMNTGTPARRDALTATTAALRWLALGLAPRLRGGSSPHRQYDARLVAPVLLTTRAVIFNWKDALQRDRILQVGMTATMRR